MRKIWSIVGFLFLISCVCADAHWWNIVDDYKAVKKEVKSLLHKGESLADGVLRMGDKDIEKLKNLYHNDIDKLWADVKGGFKTAEDELDAAAKIGMNVFDKLTASAQQYLRELAYDNLLAASTKSKDVRVRTQQFSTQGSTAVISADVINRAYITAFGGSDFSVRVGYKKLSFKIDLPFGGENNTVNYNSIDISKGSRVKHVVLKQEIGNGNHHYYGVNVNIGSVSY